MKKLIAILFTCVLCFSLASGCSSSSTSYSKSGAYWLKNSQTGGIADVDEKSEYEIEVKPYKKADVTLTITTGTYVTHLTKSTLPESDEACYKLESSMVLKGTYSYKSKTANVDDSLHSIVYFKGYGDNIKPYRTEKQVVSTSPVPDGSSIKFETIKYEYVVDYGNKAVTSFKELSDGILETPEKSEKSYNSSSFCENELLMFYPRMYKIESGFNITLKTYSVIQNEMLSLAVKAESTNADMTTDCTIYGHKQTSIKTDCLSFCKTGTYSGSKLYAYYSTQTTMFKNNVLLKFSTPAFSTGDLVYSLKTFTTNQFN